MAGNELGDKGAEKLCAAILKNTKLKLQVLDLSENQITENCTDTIDSLKSIDIKIFLSGNPIDSKKKKAHKRAHKSSSTDQKKKKTKSKNSLARSETSLKPVAPITNTPSTTNTINPRRNILEARLQAAQSKEEEYLSQIDELEARVKELSKGKLSLLNSVFSPRKSKTAMTVSTKSIIITQKIAGGGGSSAEIFSCIVDGWSVVMKELSTSEMSQTSIESFSREIRLLELLPPHENIVRYLFHEVKDNFLRLFMTQYDCNLGQYIREMKSKMNPFLLKQFIKFY